MDIASDFESVVKMIPGLVSFLVTRLLGMSQDNESFLAGALRTHSGRNSRLAARHRMKTIDGGVTGRRCWAIFPARSPLQFLERISFYESIGVSNTDDWMILNVL